MIRKFRVWRLEGADMKFIEDCHITEEEARARAIHEEVIFELIEE